jgi:2-isopropylmalate synthase
MKSRILNIEQRSAQELIKHSAGPGLRFVMSDYKNNPGSSLYVAARSLINVDHPEPHVEPHVHENESMFLFLGQNLTDFTGLEAEVMLGGGLYRVQSPSAISISGGEEHTYRPIKGSGIYLNIVLTPGANYNATTK